MKLEDLKVGDEIKYADNKNITYIVNYVGKIYIVMTNTENNTEYSTYTSNLCNYIKVESMVKVYEHIYRYRDYKSVHNVTTTKTWYEHSCSHVTMRLIETKILGEYPASKFED